MALAHDYRVMRSDRGFMCMVTNPILAFGSSLSEHQFFYFLLTLTETIAT